MYIEYKCLECGKVFSADKEQLEYAKNSVGTQAKKHIREFHKMDIKDYVVKHYFNGITPTCECGCGKDVTFTPKNCFWAERHGFRKYCHCSHKTANYQRVNIKDTEAYKSKWMNREWLLKHYDDLYGLDVIKSAAADFLNEDNEYTWDDIIHKYNITKHTLKDVWFRLGYMTEEQYKKKAQKNQRKLASKHRSKKFENSDEICEILFNIIKSFPLKYNITSLLNYYNNTNLIQIESDRYIVLDKLLEKYGDELYSYLQFGSHSKEEIEFIKILRYYFGKKYVKAGKKLQYGTVYSKYYVYDCCIADKILIEYDGSGYYHQDEDRREQDKNKETFAIENNYIFMRISDKSAKDPNTLIKIKNILNTLQND